MKYPDAFTQANLLVHEHPDFKEQQISEKRIFVIGEDFNYYYHNEIATPYIDWKLKAYIFDDLDTYAYAGYVFDVFKKSSPDVIVDQKGYMPIIIEKIPFVANSYKRLDSTVYYFKK